MATYGGSGAPSTSTFNYDAVVAASTANYSPTLVDNISKKNLFFMETKKRGWKSKDGGLYLIEDLMYDLTPADTYSGADELPVYGTDGITQAQYDWAQMAVPIMITELERKKNKQRIINLLESKLKQADIGMQEAWAKFFIQGGLLSAIPTNIYTPRVSAVNGSSGVNPLFQLIDYDPTASRSIGNINQSTQTWWRNNKKQSAATTYDGFLAEVLNMKNNCSKGPGGAPDMLWCDQITWELFVTAYYQKYKTEMKEVGDYPFPVVKFQNTLVSWDEFMPDVHNGTLTPDTGKGTMVFINSQFMDICYESETNFVATEFQRPINQDAKYKHILWMGNVTANNRRKLGVIGNIARTLT